MIIHSFTHKNLPKISLNLHIVVILYCVLIIVLKCHTSLIIYEGFWNVIIQIYVFSDSLNRKHTHFDVQNNSNFNVYF